MTDRRPGSVTGEDKMDGAVDEVKLLDIDWSGQDATAPA